MDSNKRTFFHFFRITSFTVSGDKKKQNYSGSRDARTYRFGFLKLRNCQKAQIVMKLVEVATHFSREKILHFIHPGVIWKLLSCTRVFRWKIFGFFSLCQNSDRPVGWKNCYYFWKSWFFNYFVSTYLLARYLHWRFRLETLNQRQTIFIKNC